MVNENYTELETAEKFNEIIGTYKLVVADFYAEWCMPCLMLSPILEDLSEQMPKIKFVKINIEDNEELTKKHNVSNVPCIVFFKDGKEINRIIGAHSSEMIEQKILSCLN